MGERVKFGSYPQGANGKVEPLVWRVLAVESGKALLITDKLIDCVKYYEEKYYYEYVDVTWETCTLRKWMNSDFLNKAFSSSQLFHIATVINQNPNNPLFGTKGGKATWDKIFVLNIDEANQYFSNDDDRMAAPTEYAKKQGMWICEESSLPSGEKTGWWRLRSPGFYGNLAAHVHNDGHVNQGGYDVCGYIVAVRPAFWLNL